MPAAIRQRRAGPAMRREGGGTDGWPSSRRRFAIPAAHAAGVAEGCERLAQGVERPEGPTDMTAARMPTARKPASTQPVRPRLAPEPARPGRTRRPRRRTAPVQRHTRQPESGCGPPASPSCPARWPVRSGRRSRTRRSRRSGGRRPRSRGSSGRGCPGEARPAWRSRAPRCGHRDGEIAMRTARGIRQADDQGRYGLVEAQAHGRPGRLDDGAVRRIGLDQRRMGEGGPLQPGRRARARA